MQALLDRYASEHNQQLVYALCLSYVAASSYLLLMLFSGSLRAMIDLATSISFVVAPAIGAANLRLVTRDAFPRRHRPQVWLRGLAWAGLCFLVGFGVVYARTL